jgi:hypothetical protein
MLKFKLLSFKVNKSGLQILMFNPFQTIHDLNFMEVILFSDKEEDKVPGNYTVKNANIEHN